MLVNLLGWTGNIFFIVGVYLLGEKDVKGFYINSVANALYAVQSIIMNNVPLFWLSIALIILNVKGIYEWRKKWEI